MAKNKTYSKEFKTRVALATIIDIIYHMVSNYSWYKKNVKINYPDTLHQVLIYGNLEDIKAMNIQLGQAYVRDTFLNYPKKAYTRASFNFISKFILKIENTVNEKLYLKDTPRYIR